MKPTAFWGPESKRQLTKKMIRNSSSVYQINNALNNGAAGTGGGGMVTSVSGNQISLPTNGLHHELPSIPEFHHAEDDEDDDEENRAPMFTARNSMHHSENEATATEDDSTDKPLMFDTTRI
jgi:hypothetical protein